MVRKKPTKTDTVSRPVSDWHSDWRALYAEFHDEGEKRDLEARRAIALPKLEQLRLEHEAINAVVNEAYSAFLADHSPMTAAQAAAETEPPLHPSWADAHLLHIGWLLVLQRTCVASVRVTKGQLRRTFAQCQKSQGTDAYFGAEHRSLWAHIKLSMAARDEESQGLFKDQLDAESEAFCDWLITQNHNAQRLDWLIHFGVEYVIEHLAKQIRGNGQTGPYRNANGRSDPWTPGLELGVWSLDTNDLRVSFAGYDPWGYQAIHLALTSTVRSEGGINELHIGGLSINPGEPNFMRLRLEALQWLHKAAVVTTPPTVETPINMQVIVEHRLDRIRETLEQQCQFIAEGGCVYLCLPNEWVQTKDGQRSIKCLASHLRLTAVGHFPSVGSTLDGTPRFGNIAGTNRPAAVFMHFRKSTTISRTIQFCAVRTGAFDFNFLNYENSPFEALYIEGLPEYERRFLRACYTLPGKVERDELQQGFFEGDNQWYPEEGFAREPHGYELFQIQRSYLRARNRNTDLFTSPPTQRAALGSVLRQKGLADYIPLQKAAEVLTARKPKTKNIKCQLINDDHTEATVIPIVTAKQTKPGSQTHAMFVPEGSTASAAGIQIRRGDLLVRIVGRIDAKGHERNRVIRVTKALAGYILGEGLILVRARHGTYTKYLKASLVFGTRPTPTFNDWLHYWGYGSKSRKIISAVLLRKFKIALPALEVQRETYRLHSQITKWRDNNERQMQRIGELPFVEPIDCIRYALPKQHENHEALPPLAEWLMQHPLGQSPNVTRQAQINSLQKLGTRNRWQDEKSPILSDLLQRFARPDNIAWLKDISATIENSRGLPRQFRAEELLRLLRLWKRETSTIFDRFDERLLAILGQLHKEILKLLQTERPKLTIECTVDTQPNRERQTERFSTELTNTSEFVITDVKVEWGVAGLFSRVEDIEVWRENEVVRFEHEIATNKSRYEVFFLVHGNSPLNLGIIDEPWDPAGYHQPSNKDDDYLVLFRQFLEAVPPEDSAQKQAFELEKSRLQKKRDESPFLGSLAAAAIDLPPRFPSQNTYYEISIGRVWAGNRTFIFHDDPGEALNFQNPYITGNSIEHERQDIFFGREHLLDQLVRAVSDTGGSSIVFIAGARRMGKTSLIKHLLGRLKDTSKGLVYADLQAANGSDTASVWRYLCLIVTEEAYAQLNISLVDLEVDVASLSPARRKRAWRNWITSESADFETFQDLCTRYTQHLKGEALILCVDEFDRLHEATTHAPGADAIPGQLRSLVQHVTTGAIRLVLCGAKLYELTEDYWQPLRGAGESYNVGPLEPPEARRLVLEPVLEHLNFAPGVADVIVEVTGAQPYIVQGLCNGIVKLAINENFRTITQSDLERALKIYLQSAQHFSALWSKYHQTALEQLLLFELARGPATIKALRTRYGLDRINTQSIADTLTDMERKEAAIRKTRSQDSEDFLYQHSLPLFGRWIMETQDPALVRAPFEALELDDD